MKIRWVRRSKYGGASFFKGENSCSGDFCFSSEKEQQLLANKCTPLWSCDSALFGLLALVLYSARCFLWRSVSRCLAVSPLVLPSSSVTWLQPTRVEVARENWATKGPAKPCAVRGIIAFLTMTHTVFPWSDAAATIFFIARFSAATIRGRPLIEGGVY